MGYKITLDRGVLQALTPIFEPLVRGRFVEKAAHIQPVLSRDQFDVLPLRRYRIYQCVRFRRPDGPWLRHSKNAARRLLGEEVG
jgi:hypothetical protein